MTVLAKFKKYPDEVQDYDIDFSDWLEGLGADTSVSHTIKDFPDGLSVLASHLNTQTGIVKVWVTGGETNEIYPIVVVLTTAAGRVKEAEISVRVIPYADVGFVEV